MSKKKKPDKSAPNKPKKRIPVKPDINPDPTKIKPGVNDPEKIDPTRIDEPSPDISKKPKKNNP